MDRGVPRGRHRFGWAWRAAGRRWSTHEQRGDPEPQTMRDLVQRIPYPGDVTYLNGYRFEMLGQWPSVHVSPDDAPEDR